MSEPSEDAEQAAEAAREALWDHLRAVHRYEPLDWRGFDFEEATIEEDFYEWVETHRREHRSPLDYWSSDEWKILKHPVTSTESAPRESVPMLGEREEDE